MFNSGVLATQKSVISRAYRNFGTTTIAILSSSKSYDHTGAVIMQKIREQAEGDVRFIGMGGEEMYDAGLEKSYADPAHLADKPFIPFKNFLRSHLVQPIHPATFWLKKANRDIMKELTQNDFWNACLETKPSVYLTLGNHFFMKSVYEGIGGLYLNNGLLKPPLLHFDHLIINQRQEFEAYCDYWLYANPRQPVNWANYKFPSTFVGSYTASRALQYLYKQSSKTRHLVEENTILIAKDPSNNANITDALIEEERARFRQKNNVSEEATLIYTLPGNTAEEIKWSIPILHGTVKHFLDQYGQYSSSNFAVVITSVDRHSHLIDQELAKHQWPCRIIVTNTEEEKLSALAASDFGAVMNGDAVAEAAVYRIPVVVLNNTNWFQSYMTLLYNSFNCNLNIAMNGEVFPEVLGQAFPSKIAEYWSEWFDLPYKRYSLVERFNPLTPKLLPEVGGEAVEETIQTKQVVNPTPVHFDRFYHSDYLTAKKVLDAAKLFNQSDAKGLKHFNFGVERAGLLETLGK